MSSGIGGDNVKLNATGKKITGRKAAVYKFKIEDKLLILSAEHNEI